MKEIHAPLMAQIVPVVLTCLDAGREFFGIASVPGAEISGDQAEMTVFISCERDAQGACKFAKRCVREVVDVLRRSKLLRAIPYVTFKPAPQDAVAQVGLLIDQAKIELDRAKAKEAAAAPAQPAAPAVTVATFVPAPKAAPAKKPAAKKVPAKKAPAKKPAAKKAAKAPAKKAVKKPAVKKAAKKIAKKPAKAPAKKPAAKAKKSVKPAARKRR